ncbi:MAG TPA: type II toxin-antitoxin system HicB family antitoxin [Reyranella sp.]|nr:type II toxin-antitoxin system HicB family antitoxin [Reyranella sp.]
MLYPIAIEEGTDNAAFGVVVPDLPGCFAAGDTLDEAVSKARQAAAAWIDAAHDKGMEIPKASPLNDIRSKLEYAGWAFALIDIGGAGKPRSDVMGAYQQSHEPFGELYKKLAR